MSGPAVTKTSGRAAPEKGRGKRVRITLGYNEGRGSDLEEALTMAGLSPSDFSTLTQVLILGALAWANGGGVMRTRDGLRPTLPGVEQGAGEPVPVAPATATSQRIPNDSATPRVSAPKVATNSAPASEASASKPLSAVTSASERVRTDVAPAPATVAPPVQKSAASSAPAPVAAPKASPTPAATTGARAAPAVEVVKAQAAESANDENGDARQDSVFDPMDVNLSELALPPLGM